jgi:hypothetical protein
MAVRLENITFAQKSKQIFKNKKAIPNRTESPFRLTPFALPSLSGSWRKKLHIFLKLYLTFSRAKMYIDGK